MRPLDLPLVRPVLRVVFSLGLLSAAVPSSMAAPESSMPAAMAAAATAPAASVRELLSLEEDGAEVVIASLVTQVNAASGESARTLEKEFVSILETPGSSFAARQFSCRMLARIGGERCIPVLEKKLDEVELSHAARLALEAIPGKQSLAALRRGLDRTQGATRLGVIDSLGARGDAGSVKDLAAIARGDDEPAAAGALKALGRIGGDRAARALLDPGIPGTRLALRTSALLACAESLPADKAVAIYRPFDDPKEAPQVRTAVFLGLVRREPVRALDRITNALNSGDPVLLAAAQAAIVDWNDAAGVDALVSRAPTLPAPGKTALLRGLAGRSPVAARPDLINPLMADADSDVRLAAVQAADLLGEATSVAALVTALGSGGEVGRAAQRSLENIQGAGVVDELMRFSGLGDANARASLISMLPDRQATQAVPMLYEFLGDGNSRVRQAAIKALGRLASVDDIARLTDLILTTGYSGDRPALAQATSSVAKRDPVPERRSAPIIAALERADGETQVLLLGALGSLGGDAAYSAVKQRLDGIDPALQKAAIRALGEWPDAAPLQDLAIAVTSSEDPSSHILALRGYIRSISLATDRPVDARAELFREALGMAERPEEKWLVLAGLAELPSPDALKIVASVLDDPALKNEGILASAKIATSLAKSHPGEARAALDRVVRECNDTGVVRKARLTLETLP